MGKKNGTGKAKRLLREMKCDFIPDYRGVEWISPSLPDKCELWLPGKGRTHSIAKDLSHHRAISVEFQRAVQQSQWKWPSRTICFVSDLHADTDAFFASLVASGGISKTGQRDRDFELTRSGRKALFLIGGDCFDKGPSNLRLLRAIRKLTKKGARVRILAGNHDVRMMQGIHSVGLEDDPRTDHFFVRMGPKMVPFLKEIWDEYLDGKRGLRGVPELHECRRRLYPRKRWFSDFPRLASWVMPDKTIEREMKKLREKMDSFEQDCERAGLSLRMVYAAVKQWERLFVDKRGEFSWFFRQMRLAYRSGSFLFLHAGLDDRIAKVIRDKGVRYLNKEFSRQVLDDPFDFYYGPLANTLRTKYRDVDMPLTRQGVSAVNECGVYILVHGHHNRLQGQRIMLRKGMINFECDTTLDRNSRKKEGLKGIGAAATVFTRQHQVLGISTDYPAVKLFDPRILMAN
jgi:hypothetical protein